MRLSILCLMLAARVHAQEPVINIPGLDTGKIEHASPEARERAIRHLLGDDGTTTRLDLPRPEPALAAVNGLFLPGGGWFYLAGKAEGNYDLIGIGFFGVSVALIDWIANAVKHHHKDDIGIGSVCFLAVRWADIGFATSATADERDRSLRPSRTPPRD